MADASQARLTLSLARFAAAHRLRPSSIDPAAVASVVERSRARACAYLTGKFSAAAEPAGGFRPLLAGKNQPSRVPGI